jgi:tetratricopeptide (TPR) repeat protein
MDITMTSDLPTAKEGERFFTEGRFEEALRIFQLLILQIQNGAKTKQNILYLHYRYGCCLIKMRKTSQAEQYFETCLEQHSEMRDTQTIKVRTLIRKDLAESYKENTGSSTDETFARLLQAQELLDSAWLETKHIANYDADRIVLADELFELYTSLGEHTEKQNQLDESKKWHEKGVKYGEDILKLQESEGTHESEMLSIKYRIAFCLHGSWEFRKAAEVYKELQNHIVERKKSGVMFPDLDFDADMCEEGLMEAESRARARARARIKQVRMISSISVVTDRLRRICHARANWLLVYRRASLLKYLIRWKHRYQTGRDGSGATRLLDCSMPGSWPSENGRLLLTRVYDTYVGIPSGRGAKQSRPYTITLKGKIDADTQDRTSISIHEKKGPRIKRVNGPVTGLKHPHSDEMSSASRRPVHKHHCYSDLAGQITKEDIMGEYVDQKELDESNINGRLFDTEGASR